jgi:hypothetical protein
MMVETLEDFGVGIIKSYPARVRRNLGWIGLGHHDSKP